MKSSPSGHGGIGVAAGVGVALLALLCCAGGLVVPLFVAGLGVAAGAAVVRAWPLVAGILVALIVVAIAWRRRGSRTSFP